MITGTTKLLGIIGHPVEHSLSPVMQNAALAHLNLDYIYLPFPVQPEALEQAVLGLAAMGVQGFNVTIPHKHAIVPLLTEVSDMAWAVGAVNTVWRTESGWSGTNTDVAGFLAPLKALEQDWSRTEAVVLGNGGAARAVVAGCAQLGCRTVWVVGRDRSKLQNFQRDWEESFLETATTRVNLQIHQWDDLATLLPQVGLLVNTTPIGMHPQIDQSPLEAAELDALPAQAIVYDLIYTPNPTQLLQQAQARQLVTIDGLEMLVQQGAAALERWIGQPAPVDVMRQALQQHLGLI